LFGLAIIHLTWVWEVPKLNLIRPITMIQFIKVFFYSPTDAQVNCLKIVLMSILM
jgi:multisubunit Na+/H+ antiporter MnhE subunit